MQIRRDQQKNKEKKTIKIRCEFRESLTQKVKRQLFMYSGKLKLLDKERWSFYHERYTKESWDKLMPYMRVGICQWIQIFNANCPHAITSLSNTNFPYLKHLSILNSQIVNIEALAFLDGQNLKAINLKMNMITSFKPLDKMKFAELSLLFLSQNIDNQFEYRRIKLSKKCQVIYDEYIINPSYDYEDDIEHPQPKCHQYRQDYSKLAKLQPQDIKSKRYNNQSRIHQGKVNQVLTSKYSSFITKYPGAILLCGGRY